MKIAFYSIFFTLFCLFSKVYTNEIALSFDDAPKPGSMRMQGDERTRLLIDKLVATKVPGAIFYVTGRNVDENTTARLTQYVDAGFYLGNHSYAHQSANKTDTDTFLLDAYKAHLVLKNYENVLPLFRFPFLHYGSSTKDREKIYAGLRELGYKIGYVTVDNYDWYLDSLLQKALKQGRKVNYSNLGRLYVDILWEAIVFYDEIAKKTLGRSPKHVLLLHENDLAALYIDKLVSHIREKGWTLISAEDAYRDPIAKDNRGLSFNKQGRVAALAHRSGVETTALRHSGENTEYLDTQVSGYEVFE